MEGSLRTNTKMVNMVAMQMPILRGLMKMAGVTPHKVEIEPGTIMNIWVPVETIPKKKKGDENKKMATASLNKPIKPVVVLVHGFAAEGIVTWQFQVRALAKKYSVYVPDLLFFGGSITDKADRSPAFQAETLIKGLTKLRVDKCVVVGFSYGGMVTFKMAEMHPQMVQAMVVSGSVFAMTASTSEGVLNDLGMESSSELLLPTSVSSLKKSLALATYKRVWLPDRLFKDFLEVMFTNRKERAELLEGLIISSMKARVPNFSQKIHLLWGENDCIFNVELGRNLNELLGENATFESIQRAGHLVHLERPCIYNKCLKQFLSSLSC